MNKNATYLALIAATMLAVSSCNSSDTKSTENKMDTTVSKMETATQNAVNDVKQAVVGNEDSNFVVKAAVTNNTELKILQAGIDNGTNKELKAHAKMMMADHKKLGDKVKAYATSKGYVLPDSTKGDALATINSKTKGADWDKAWVNHMVDAHKDCISMFEKGKDNVKDSALKTMIVDALPTLNAHLDMMKTLQDKMGK